MKHVEVVCALIMNDNNEIFICKRGVGELAGKWEFPGGKVEKNETKEHAVEREIKEELSCTIKTIKYLCSAYYEYQNLKEPFSITMYAYLAKITEGYPILSEHTDSRWKEYNDFKNFDFALADVELIKKIKIDELKE